MRVLQIIASADPKSGGPIEGVHRMAEVWNRHGHETHILSLDPPGSEWIATSAVPIFAVGRADQDGRFARLTLARYGFSPKLREWLTLNARHYDAIILNGVWNFSSFGSWRALHSGRYPYVIFTHGMLDPWFNRYRLKTIFKRLYWRLFEHKVLRDAEHVLFTTSEEMHLARLTFRPYACREAVVGFGTLAPSGDAGAQIAAFEAAHPGLRGKRFLLFLGRLHPKKGLPLLLQAFAKVAADVDDLDLVIAGPEQDRSYVRQLHDLADRERIASRVHWPGMIEGDVKWGALRAAHAFVLPSHQENFGVVVAEALACGTPVLLTDKVNIWREVEASRAGFAVHDDVQGVADGLERMLRLSGTDHAAMKVRAAACFSEHFNLESVALRLLGLIAPGRG